MAKNNTLYFVSMVFVLKNSFKNLIIIDLKKTTYKL